MPPRLPNGSNLDVSSLKSDPTLTSTIWHSEKLITMKTRKKGAIRIFFRWRLNLFSFQWTDPLSCKILDFDSSVYLKWPLGLIPYSMNIPTEILVRSLLLFYCHWFQNSNSILMLLLTSSYVPFGLYLLYLYFTFDSCRSSWWSLLFSLVLLCLI